MPRTPYNDDRYQGTRGSRSAGYARRRKKKKNFAPLLIGLFAILLVAGTAVLLSINSYGEQQQANREAELTAKQELLAQTTFYNNIFINGENVGGKTYEQVKKQLGVTGDVIEGKALLLENGDNSYSISVKGASNATQVLDDAYAIGHTGEVPERLEQIAALEQTPAEFTVGIQYTIDNFEERIEEAEKVFSTAPIPDKATGFDVASMTFTIEKGKPGIEVDHEALVKSINEALSSGELGSIQVPTREATSDKYDLKDAKPVLLSTFTTECVDNRKRNTNIELCSSALSGTVVMPGEQFSVNGITGPRTEEQGYQEAKVIKGGVYVEEPGGGVCQVSSTLYNCVVRAGFKIDERYNHTIVSSYVPQGEDAAIDYPNKDFKFTNNSKAPVAVLFEYSRKTALLTASVYGMPILAEGETLNLATELVREVPQPEDTFIEDATLGYQEQVLVSQGRAGSQYKTYLVHLKNGVETEREFFYNSHYPAKATVYAHNTLATPDGGIYDVPVEPGATEPVIPDIPDIPAE